MAATSPAGTSSSVAPGTDTSATRHVRAWRGPLVGPAVAVLGSAAIALGGLLPVWGTRLVAPQYPKGLELWFYGDRVVGPVREVNGLNHYIGMQSIDLARVPEMALWPLAIIGSALLLVTAVLWRGWLSRLALLILWLVPLVVLADIQRWLIVFGTELDPRAALRLEGFVPLVVGATQVWNFAVVTYPGPALVVVLAVALVATVARRAQPPQPRARSLSAATALGIAAAGSLLLLLPVPVAAQGVHAGHAVDAGATSRETASGTGSAVDLQALVDGAEPGSTVRVPAGHYRIHLVIDRSLTLVADGEVWLDGSGIGSVVTIAADRVTLRGFHLTGTGGQVEVAAAVKVIDADAVTIEGNHLHDFFHGIVALDATNVRVIGNRLDGAGADHADVHHLDAGATEASSPVILGAHPRDLAADAFGDGPGGQGDGIYLWDTTAATVRGNVIRDVRDGIYLSYAPDVLVDGNSVRDSRFAVHAMFGGPVTVFGNDIRSNLAGLVLMYTQDVLAGRNLLLDQRSGATGVGVVLKDVDGVRVAENVIARNRIGLKAEGTRWQPEREAVVLRNRFDSNDTAVSLFSSADLGFAANTFEDNLTDVHATDRGVADRNDWTYQGTGNHWSGYGGFDLDDDGVGDVPHTSGGALDVLVSAAPALQLYRGSLVMHALQAAQELWEADRAVIVRDHAPRIDDPAPRAADLAAEALQAGSARDADLDGAPWSIAGLVLAGLTVAWLGSARAGWRRDRS